MRPTPLYHALFDVVAKIKPIVIVIDNVADVFGGNEIVRTEVRQFIALMRHLAVAANGYVILSSHPSLSGIANKTGSSGSTQWHNSVRARAWMHGGTPNANAKGGDDGTPTSGNRVLEFMKANYSALAERVELEWKGGLYLPVPTPSGPEAAAANAEAEAMFVALLKRFAKSGRKVNASPPANNYAPRSFAGEPEAKKARITVFAFKAAMERLIADDKIYAFTYGRASNPSTCLMLREASS